MERRSNWSRVVVSGVVQPFPPLTIVRQDPEGRVLGIAGIVSEAFNVVQSRLGFQSDLSRPRDGIWSRFLPNGTVLGMVSITTLPIILNM